MEQSIYRISLELQSGRAPAALDMKRGDTGRRIFITLTDGGKPYPVREDCYAVFTARKPDENPIFNRCAVEGNTVIYDVTPQTTAAAGELDCEIKLYGSDDCLITSAAFGITVHDAVYNHEDEPVSEAEVEALTHLVSQTNTLLEAVQQKLDSGEFKGEKGDKGEQGEKGEKGDKGEQGEKGDPGEANIEDTCVGADAWSGKNIADRLCPAFSESGTVVTCQPVEGYPLGVVSQIVPVQEGEGDPSPDNVRPITGCTEAKLYCVGKNLFDGYWESGMINTTTGADVFDKNSIRTGYIPIVPGTTYYFTVKKWANIYPITYYKDKTFARYLTLRNSSFAFTAAANERFIRIAQYADPEPFGETQLEIGSAATAYEPYRGGKFTLDFGQTVYGGSLDWQSGVLTADRKRFLFDGSEAWAILGGETDELLPIGLQGDPLGIARENTALCDRFIRKEGSGVNAAGEVCIDTSDVVQYNVRFAISKTLAATLADWKAYLAENPMEFVCRITEPVAVQLTPQQLPALSGTNQLFGDTGDITVTGRADPVAVIEKLTNAVLSLGGNI